MPNLLSPAQVAELAATLQDLSFTETFEVLRSTTVSDSMGGTTSTEAVVDSGACLLVGLTGARALRAAQELVVAAELRTEMPYAVDLPLGTDITARDRLRINGTRIFEVQGVITGSQLDIVQTAVCREIV